MFTLVHNLLLILASSTTGTSSLSSLLTRKVIYYDIILTVQTIKWLFSLPNAPHFGGKWKAIKKSIKLHLVWVTDDLEGYKVLINTSSLFRWFTSNGGFSTTKIPKFQRFLITPLTNAFVTLFKLPRIKSDFSRLRNCIRIRTAE